MRPDEAAEARRLRCRLDAEVFGAEQKISQGVAVERPRKCCERFLERSAQAATRSDQATVVAPETFDQGKIGLRSPQHLAQPDLRRSLSNRQAAGTASNRPQKPGAGQLVGHLHQVRARNPVDLGGFLDGDQLTVPGRSVQEHAERVVGKIRQSHRKIPVLATSEMSPTHERCVGHVCFARLRSRVINIH